MRPARLVVVVGTGTNVGKTWVSCRLLERWRADGATVAARKPAQSFLTASGAARGAGGAHALEPTDADLLAAATGEQPGVVCPAHRWYGVPMAPPMAADALGLPPIALDGLLSEVTWPEGIDLGLVETAGGVRSPIADDGDAAELVRRLKPDVVLLVADAELGVINAVRSSVDALTTPRIVVLLNRYDTANELHRRNHEWLADRDGLDVQASLDSVARRLRTN